MSKLEDFRFIPTAKQKMVQNQSLFLIFKRLRYLKRVQMFYTLITIT